MARPRRALAVVALAALAGGGTFAAVAFGGTDALRLIAPAGSPLPLPATVSRLGTEAQAELAREAAQAERAQIRRANLAAQREADAAADASADARAEAELETLPAPAQALDPTESDQAIVRADVLDNGIALPPLESPPEVRAIIEAGNGIARTPYLWGGGHGKWQDKGYDCSGSVSFALASAGLLDRSLTSGQLMSWGKPGKGRWVTVWSNDGHVFLEVAGVRFDTSGTKTKTGSRWQRSMRSRAGFVARHPQGL